MQFVCRKTANTRRSSLTCTKMCTSAIHSFLEKVTEKLKFVKDFKVCGMGKLPEELRSQLVEFAAEVIE